jgi:D-lactate dehydrogenase (cytochrome)
MPSWVLRGRRPEGERADPSPVNDRDVIQSHLQDAAHFPGGHASTLYRPSSEREIANILRAHRAVLPVGAQSSLTGGATPMGDAVISTARLNRIQWIGTDRARVQAGVTLTELDEALRRAGRFYPPSPTFTGAFVGGTVSTNAAGAATFKYGSTRPWVEAVTIVLASGDVLDVDRGATRAHPDGYFDIELPSGSCRVPVPTYRMPAVPKLSAGYFAEREMDLIDLFVGSEGTLGVVTEITLRVLPARPSCCLALVPFVDPHAAFLFVGALRDISLATRRDRDPRGLDASAIEHMDARSLELLREEGILSELGVPLPAQTMIALLVTLELPADHEATPAADGLRVEDMGGGNQALARLADLLAEHGQIDDVHVALPGERSRARQLIAIREAVPAAVNKRVGQLQSRLDPRISKTAADVIVPFERFEEWQAFCDHQFRRLGLDVAVWGHISDGNVHPNLIPRSFEEVERGREAVLNVSREAVRLGGASLAEHGVGRNRLKQQLLAELYGEAGIDEMRCVKAALDPEWKLSPGVLFEKAAPLR